MTAQLPTAEELLFFSPQAKATDSVLVCSIYQDERPFKGAVGSLDWRLHGFISNFVIGGFIEGRRGELIYLPVNRRHGLRHILLVGLGTRSEDNESSLWSAELLTRLRNTTHKLHFKRLIFSRSGFPFFEPTQIQKAFHGTEIEFVQ